MNSAAEFFGILDERARAAGQNEALWISVQGYVVRLTFCGIEVPEAMRINLGYLLVEPQERADEEVLVWEDDLDELMGQSMVPEEERYIHYHQCDEWHVLFPGVVRRMGVRDNVGRRTWVCFQQGGGLPEAYVNKPFASELQWWLWDDYLLLHGAAVGAGGHGALITAPSGKGKSTLALACLVAGMDYVAEDYVLVNRRGPAVAHPLLNTAYLTPATLDMLPELKETILLYVDWRNKFLVDLSRYGTSFKDELPLDAMIYPVVSDADEPSIVPARSVKPFIAALTTTAKQIKSRADFSESFKALFLRMKTIPAYEMRLTHDLRANARALEEFLRGL